jgi:hypothetical protein
MQSREINQFNDEKKASESSNRSDVGKKGQTHEDRCSYYDRFLKPLKSLALGTMMLTAGMSGAEARLEPSGSALQSKESHDNITGLLPTFHQTEFNNLSHPTALEFNPYTYKVTPELLDHLRNVGVKNPEQFIQNIQKREQRQKDRWLVKNAPENPDVLEGLRELFKEIPDKESKDTPQPTTEIHQDKGKGKESLSSNKEKMASLRVLMEKAKIDLEVMGRARKLLAEVKGKESSEQAHRKLLSSCFQWGIPNEVTAIGISDGDGTAIQVTYNLNTINTCKGTISNIAFQATETIVCPAGCAESLMTKTPEISGLPSSIAQGQTSTGTRYETIACTRIDANGAKTPTVPTSMSTVVYPTGTQGDSSFLQGMPESFNVYPS